MPMLRQCMLFGLLLVIAVSHAFVVPTSPAHMRRSLTKSELIVMSSEGPISVSPLQGLVIATGAFGIVGAAFCTSTGSPPNGLAVATVALVLMYLGAGAIESSDA